MIQAQVLLTQLGIPQQDVQNLYAATLPGQEGLDQAAQDCVTILQALKTGVYRSPAYAEGTDPMAQFNQTLGARMTAQSFAAIAALQAGNISQYHADLDALNRVKAERGEASVTGKPDMDVLSNAPGPLGRFAQYIVDQIANGKTLFTDVAAAGKAIAAAQSAPPPPPPAPPVTIQVGQPSDPHPVPVGTTIKDQAGNSWEFIACPFGLYWIRV